MAQRTSAITSRIVGITDRLRPQRHGQLDADALVREVLRHYPEGDGELVRRAFVYASEAHLGQKRNARRAIGIHPPLPHRLGIWQNKWEREDLAFKYLEPEQYRDIAEQLAARRQVRERYINETMKTLAQELEKAGVRAELSGRAKHLRSIAQKMQRQCVSFDEVYDVLAIRMIVGDLPLVYRLPVV